MALSISKLLLTIYVVSHYLTLQLSITEARNSSSISFELHGEDGVHLDGDARVMNEKVIQLTNIKQGLQDEGTACRVVYNIISLCNSDFTTLVQFQINWTAENESNRDYDGDGLSFFMASGDSGFDVAYIEDRLQPINHGRFGRHFNPQNNGNLSNYLGFSTKVYASSEFGFLRSWNSANGTSGSSEKKKIHWKVKGTVLGGSAILVVLLFVLFAIYSYTRRDRKKTQGVEEEQHSDVDIELGYPYQRFKYSELSEGTNGFSEENRIGQGGFADVYKCILRQSDKTVAAKRFTAGLKEGKKEYLAEIKAITHLRHGNLVPLLGWYHEKGELFLVYEYMPNGSLDNLLFGTRRGELLWDQRYRIAIAIANALAYVHSSGENCVLHRDIKSANVLLDSQFNAKLGNFGLARVVKHDHRHRTKRMPGTTGYLAPECANTGIYSAESDVFSFGIVALEIACGRPALDHNLQGPKLRLLDCVWKLHREDRLFDAADDDLLEKFDKEEFQKLVTIGLWCSHMDPSRRPKMKDVLHLFRPEEPTITVLNKLPEPAYPPLGQGF